MAAERHAAAEAELASQMMAGDPWGLGGLMGGAAEGRFVAIRRGQLLEDGFERISRMAPDRLRGRVRIQYIDEHGGGWGWGWGRGQAADGVGRVKRKLAGL